MHDPTLTMATLGALPARSVVLDSAGDAWQRAVDGPGAVWRKAGSNGHYRAEFITLPATVVHIAATVTP